MQSGESIYHLIPPPEVQQARPAMHKSQHPGHVNPEKFGKSPRRANATFGRAPGDVKPETNRFLKKNTGTLNATRDSLNESFDRRARLTVKPPVPKATDRPLMGLQSTKNFIAANAIENILAKPPVVVEEMKATSKKDYGKVPEYLLTIKQQIQHEKQRALDEYEKSLQNESNGATRPMSEDERDELLYQLKIKWAKLNNAYAGLSFSLDVPSHKRRKESLEKEMTQLEKDIKSLQGKQVVVMED